MKQVAAFGAESATAPLAPMRIARRDPGPTDVAISIRYCGICHSDWHQVRDEWGGALFPMVPGHEIIGSVVAVGSAVTAFRPGDTVGVGCMIDACRHCSSCTAGLEQYCENGFSPTYNGLEQDGSTPTFGGYSEYIVVEQAFVLRIGSELDPAGAAPLLCAGITTYSPLRQWQIGPGARVGIVGLGGLGHMGVKLARAMGADVAVFTGSESKVADAKRLGAQEVIVSREPETLEAQAGRFDFILDTVAALHELGPYLRALKRDGTLCLVGAPPEALAVTPFDIVMSRRRLVGSLIGGIAETQEMLDFCAAHKVVADIELIDIAGISDGFARMLRGDVKYRFVIDMKSLPA